MPTNHSSPVRIAVLSDIHGNLIAFEAALAHARSLSPDILILCGDIVNGSPDSRGCWDLALSLDVPIVRGNHERYISQANLPIPMPEWSLERFAPARWTADQFTFAERAAMGDLPLTFRHPSLPDILFCHGSPRNDNDAILAYTPEEMLAAMLAGVDEPVIVRAHNHTAQTRAWRGKSIITAGSVGLTLDHNPTAQFLLLERRSGRWETLHQSVPYDVEAAGRRFYETGFLDAVGPIGRLCLREVLTASYHWIPFLRAYAKWSPDETMPIGIAIKRFLSDDAL